MSEFQTHAYSGRAYSKEECITSSHHPLLQGGDSLDIEREIQQHLEVSHIQVSGFSQEEFDLFAERYADRYQSIYFFQNPKIKDLSRLSRLKHVEYLLFYNLREATAFWDMSGNESLKGVMVSNSKKLIYDFSALSQAPALEEVLLFSSMDRKYTVRSAEPLKQCRCLKRAFLNFNTEQKDFIPEEFAYLETLKYQVDRKRNFTY